MPSPDSQHLTSGTGTTTITLDKVRTWAVDVAPSGNSCTVSFKAFGTVISGTITVFSGDVKSLRADADTITIVRAAASSVDVYWEEG